MKNIEINTDTSRRKSHQVEYKANLHRIADLFDQGYSKKDTYELLYEKGYISMSYRHFCRFNSTGKLTAQNRAKKPIANKRPKNSKSNLEFSHNNVVTKEDFDELIG
ncbi:TraK family protein [Desulfovibrio sp. JC010]|uniref:TraK family protein n=1 Tax=Desulfovibrio sp. JC010 TaxID=2593641 RepID=UPI0013D861C8|nr:TraK family protein [Desulfovibrio sp. JC010]NDV28130.1 hypothetical protein [Desulfovibrio sp. JC010]